MGGRRLPRQSKEMDRGRVGRERGGRAQAAQARTRGGGQALGCGMGQGGQGGGLAEIDAAERFPGAAEEMGCGAHLRVDLSQPEDEQGLREAVRNRGSVRLRCDDQADGKAIGPCVGVSRQSLEGVFCALRVDGDLGSSSHRRHVVKEGGPGPKSGSFYRLDRRDYRQFTCSQLSLTMSAVSAETVSVPGPQFTKSWTAGMSLDWTRSAPLPP